MVKLRIDDLAANGGIINLNFLGMCRTKANDVWRYLDIRNETNLNLPRLKQIHIPPQNEWKLDKAKKRISSEFDTTRVRLCFHVSLDTIEVPLIAILIFFATQLLTHTKVFLLM